MSDFAKAIDLFGINKVEESSTHNPRYTGPLLYQLS